MLFMQKFFYVFARKFHKEASSNQLKSLVELIKNTRKCQKLGKVVLPNMKIIQKAQETSLLNITEIFLFPHINCNTILEKALSGNIKYFSINENHLKNQSFYPLKSFNIIGIGNYPKVSSKLKKSIKIENECQLTVIFDNIRNYHNLASIFKILSSFKNPNVIMMKGCVDPWSWKVLEESEGCHMCNLGSLITDCGWCEVEKLLDHHNRVIIADVNFSWKNIENNTKNTSEISMKSFKYTDVDFKRDYVKKESCEHHRGIENLTIILGGETEGISKEAKKFCEDRNGFSVFIPMNHEVDSLNCAISLVVILSEIRRQWRE